MLSTHPLTTTWSVWFESGKDSERSTSQVSYGELICTIPTIEHFWGFISDFPKITVVLKGSDTFVFRNGIKPLTDDPMNRAGGRFVFSYEIRTEEQQSGLETLWQNLVCARATDV